MSSVSRNKVVIVGTGQVGATAAFSIVTHGLCNELVLIDHIGAKALGEARDLDDGSEFQDRHVRVRVGDYDDCADADIVVITVGRKPPADSNRLAELGFTVGLVGDVVDRVMASGFDGVIIMVSNPVDVMAWYAWKRSGLPRTQVIGTGTALDTSRLKTIIGEETGLDPRNVGGFVMGEHGDSQFAAWSTVSLGGKPFDRFLADNRDRFASVSPAEVEAKTRRRGDDIVKAKGGTNYGIASTVAGIVQTILWDERRIVPVSTLLDGEYGEHDVFLGVPTELRANGANEIVELDLTDEEMARLHRSADLVRSHCEGLL
ncbi:L-lactate dehydrogenase [Bifidobacterium samirii]|uniref:L-lactate dehydrogenase n=1 Tax=Bifidobacterium samirii TaxID=2306974 RepID=A0A430FTV4_9BIFI|nr:L-lactate dehydrogenase [Bifidobacterium samirii]RSX56246.1 lactate dehydrogenase [Bifidobacterium samirii]